MKDVPPAKNKAENNYFSCTSVCIWVHFLPAPAIHDTKKTCKVT